MSSSMCRLLCSALVSIVAAASASREASAQDAKSNSMIVGEIIDLRDAVVPYVFVFDLETGKSVVADSEGRFRLPLSGSSDSLWVGTRRIGYQPSTTRLSARSAGPVRLILVPLATNLASVEVTAGKGGYDEELDRTGYYRRIAQGGGTFFSLEQITRRNAPEISTMVRDVPGARVISMGNTRGPKNNVPLGRGQGGQCSLGLVINGQRIEYKTPNPESLRPQVPSTFGNSGGPTGPGLSNPGGHVAGTETFDQIVSAPMVKAMEVYPRVAAVPSEFAHLVQGCGLIVVWTR